MIRIFNNITSLAFVVGGVVLAFNSLDGWGWCFVLAVLTNDWK